MASTLTKCTLNDKLLHPNDYLAAIEMRGKDANLTIASVELEELTMQGGKKDTKPVLKFKETKKKFIVNKTNASSIAAMHGKKAELWVGKRITLFPTQAPVGKKMEDCIRIRERVPGDKVESKPQFAEPETKSADDAQPKPFTMPTTDFGKSRWADLMQSCHNKTSEAQEECAERVIAFLTENKSTDLDDKATRDALPDSDTIDWDAYRSI